MTNLKHLFSPTIILTILFLTTFITTGSGQIKEIELLPEGIVFPRLNTAERDLLSAIQGQCIYNTQTKSIECYDGTNWLGAVSSNTTVISDADADTNIKVESSPDVDEISFTTAGTEVMKHDGQTLHILNNGESVFIGENAGAADDLSGNQNTFIGFRAGEDNVTGSQNVAIGNQALRDNQSGGINIAIGKEAMAKNLGSSNNIAIGHNAGRDISSLTTKNTFLGGFAGFSHTVGEKNTFIGYEAGRNFVDGKKNIFLGAEAGKNFLDGDDNLIVGTSSFTEGSDNSVIHVSSLPSAMDKNVLFGAQCENWFSHFEGNTIVGYDAGYRQNFQFGNHGRFNTFFGHAAGNDQAASFSIVIGAYQDVQRGRNGTGGYNNVIIGNNATRKYLTTVYSNRLLIESDTTGTSLADPLIYGEFDNDVLRINGTLSVRDMPVAASTMDIRATSTGQLVISSSDARLKYDIKSITNALDKVTKLRGVSFKWNNDPESGSQLGLIAQEVNEVVPELVNDVNGLYGVDYSETIGLLVEAIKELNQKVEQLEKAK